MAWEGLIQAGRVNHYRRDDYCCWSVSQTVQTMPEKREREIGQLCKLIASCPQQGLRTRVNGAERGVGYESAKFAARKMMPDIVTVIGEISKRHQRWN